MRTFEKPNLSNNWKCPICGTNDEKEIVLIGVDGTREGNLMEGHQYHLECLELMEYSMDDTIVLAMRFTPKNGL